LRSIKTPLLLPEVESGLIASTAQLKFVSSTTLTISFVVFTMLKVWAKPIVGNAAAAILYNSNDGPANATITLDFSYLPGTDYPI